MIAVYLKFGSLASYIKNVFLTVSTERQKLMNEAHCELRNIYDGSRIESTCMVYDKVSGS